jgi:hypothetical protein
MLNITLQQISSILRFLHVISLASKQIMENIQEWEIVVGEFSQSTQFSFYVLKKGKPLITLQGKLGSDPIKASLLAHFAK